MFEMRTHTGYRANSAIGTKRLELESSCPQITTYKAARAFSAFALTYLRRRFQAKIKTA
jgi:hypothetical protein